MSISLTVGTEAPIALDNLTDLANAAESDLSLGLEFSGQLDQPISALPDNLKTTSISYSSGNQSWNLGDFTFTLSGSGKVSVMTAGTLLSYTNAFPTEVTIGLTPTTNNDNTVKISVPGATAYVAVELDSQIQAGASASINSGPYGVSGSVNASDTFSISFIRRLTQRRTLGML